MRLLIICNHFAVCSGRYAADAFTRLGHEVKHVGKPMGRAIWGGEVLARHVWEPDALRYDDYYWMFDDGSEFEPDLTLVMDSDPSVLDSIKPSQHEVIAVYGVDNHVRDYRRDWFDRYFVGHKAVSLMPWQDDMTHLPCAADSHYFAPSTIPWEQRAYDVACLGVMYPQRQLLVEAMQKAGLKVLWGQGLVYEAYAAAYQNARVSLCVSANGDLAQRIFETSRMGNAVLSDPLPDLDAFDGHPVTFYRSVDEAVALARGLQMRGNLGEASARWAADETWESRAQVIVRWWEERYDMEKDEDDMLTGRRLSELE